jgi:hypothetical protein
LPLFHLHYKEVQSGFSSLFVVYTGYSHSLLLRFTMKRFYSSFCWSPFVTRSVYNMHQVKFRHSSNQRECNRK